MKKILLASKPFLSEIAHDYMMAVCMIAPILMGVAFRFLLPFLESLLCAYFSKEQIIAPYFQIFDLLLAIMTPIMFCFSGVLVMLDEFDSGIAKYYFVTPVGKRGYLFSRLVMPAFVAMFYDVLLLFIFTVSKISLLMVGVFSICGTLMAVISAIIVIAFAKNKIEGMAWIKLCGLLIVGIPIVYFVKNPIQYVFSFLPSFWLAKLSYTGNYLFVLPTIATSIIMIYVLYIRYEKRLMK